MRVLICPLNWGLGHSARIIPIINLLTQHHFEVVVASSENSLSYLRNELPTIEFIEFPNYTIEYSKESSQVLKILFKLPTIISWTIKEHLQLNRIIKDYNIDIVISDNRYGLWNKDIYSIFISHQLKVKFPGKLSSLEFISQYVIRSLIRKYNECWIPDLEGENNLTGELSHLRKNIPNCYFVGLLSRFQQKNFVRQKKSNMMLFLFYRVLNLKGPFWKNCSLNNQRKLI